MAKALTRSAVATHPTEKAGNKKKASVTTVKFKTSRNSVAHSKKRFAIADANEVFGTLAKLFMNM